MKRIKFLSPVFAFIFGIAIILLSLWWISPEKIENQSLEVSDSKVRELPAPAETEDLQIENRTLPAPELRVKNEGEKRVKLQNLIVKTSIQNNLATTRFEMDFYNSEKRDLEAELNFPLGEGQTITYFAMDVNGKLRSGVAVEKEKARVAFESTIRKGIDPGLVEMTKGNNFKARVFPVPAKGHKRIIMEYIQELPLNRKKSLYYLPLNFTDKLSNFNLSVTVHEQELPPSTVSTNSEELKFKEVNQQFKATLNKKNFLANKSIIISIPTNSKNVSVGTINGKNYFHASILVPKKFKHKKKPTSLTIFWDASSSRSKSNIKAEISFLKSYLSYLKNVKVELIPFANTELPHSNFEVKNGNSKKIIANLNAMVYDGGTILESLKFEKSRGEEVLLFSDGLPNLGKRDFHSVKKRIYSILSSSTSDVSLLKAIAEKSNGEFINLEIENEQQALAKITKDQLHFMGFSRNSEVGEFYPQNATPLNGYIGISGESKRVNSTVTALFGYGNKVVYSKKLNLPKSTENERVAKMLEKWMVIKKINFLEKNYKLNKNEITKLGIKYRLVTRNTSLLVLDRIEDYLEHHIVPPAELQKKYFKKLKEQEHQVQIKEKSHLNTVYSSFKEQLSWWKKDRKKKKSKTKLDPPGVNDEMVLEERTVSGNAEHAPPPPPMETTAQFVPPVVMHTQDERVSNNTEVTSFASSGSFTVNATDAYASTVNELNGATSFFNTSVNAPTFSLDYGADGVSDKSIGSISVQGWDPKSPYMRTIKKAKNLKDAYKIYLTEKMNFGHQPSFFLDVSEYFIQHKDKKTGLRILSNIAELELENHSLLRILASKLLLLKEYATAIQLYKDLIELRSEEPQSYRDLGLAFAEIGNYKQAIENLYHVVKEPFDPRFNGIELIALNEINAILTKKPEFVKGSKIDKRFITQMPVDIRVVLNWDADNTDVDLWVTDPNGEKCFYSHKNTEAGGRISNDFTQGYGPEEFMIRKAIPGKYKIQAHYYGSSSQSIQGKATLTVQFFKQFGTNQVKKEEIIRRLNVTNDVIDLGTFKF